MWRERSAPLLATGLAGLYVLLLGNAAHWGGAAGAFAAAFSFSALWVAVSKLMPAEAKFAPLRRVMAFFGVTGFVVCTYFASFHGAADDLLRWSVAADRLVYVWAYHWGLFVVAALAWVLVALRARRGEAPGLAVEEWLCPIALVYSQLAGLAGGAMDAWLIAVVFNLVCFGIASAWMVRGCRESRMRPVVLGSVLLACVVFARYFDLFQSLAVRGAVFMVFGAVLFAEGFFYRKLRASNEQGRAQA